METCPKVLIVGEIYVRRDDFAVGELIRHLSRRGIIVKVSGIAEWVYYCDYVRYTNEIKKNCLYFPGIAIFAREFMDLIRWNIEQIYKHNVEKKIRGTLDLTGLIPDSPHNIEEIMKNTERHFVNQELHSEISISSGVAATAMMNGYSGIINISPFACLIGRVIEGLLCPLGPGSELPHHFGGGGREPASPEPGEQAQHLYGQRTPL